MKRILTLALAGLAASCAMQSPMEPDGEASAMATGDLARDLEGRVAGNPAGCVTQKMLRGPESGGPGVLLFDGPGDLIYVNRTGGDCGNLRNYRSIRYTTTNSQLCRGDVAQTFDPYTGVQGDYCTLGEFTPYRRR